MHDIAEYGTIAMAVSCLIRAYRREQVPMAEAIIVCGDGCAAYVDGVGHSAACGRRKNKLAPTHLRNILHCNARVTFLLVKGCRYA